MWLDVLYPETKLYDLYVDGKKQEDWAKANEESGEYELFVTDVPWRGGGKIEDKDSPYGYQTIKQTGKVELRRNDLPETVKKSTEPAEKPYNPFSDPWGYPGFSNPLQSGDGMGDLLRSAGYELGGRLEVEPGISPEETLRNLEDAIVGFGGGHESKLARPSGQGMGGSLVFTEFPTLGAIRAITCDDNWDRLSPETQNFLNGVIDREPLFPMLSFEDFVELRRSMLPHSITFDSVDGKVWLMSSDGKPGVQVEFLDTHVTGNCLEIKIDLLDPEAAEQVLVSWSPAWGRAPMVRIESPGISWEHQWGQAGCRRSFTLTAFADHAKERGCQLFQWLDRLNIRVRQEVGLPV